MVLPALVGAGASLVGGLLSSKSQKDASARAAEAAQFRPFDVHGPSGTVEIGTLPSGERAISQQLASPEQDLRGAFLSRAGQGAFGFDPTAQFGQDASQLAQNRLFQDFGAAQNAPFLQPQATQSFTQGQQSLAGQFGAAGQAGLREGFAAPTTAPLSNFAASQAGNLLGQDFGGIAQQRLDLLNQQARPQEERAVNAKFQNLFNTGRLGTTGGAQGIEALGNVQSQAELARQTEALNFADQLRAQNLQAGQGLLGLGIQGTGQDINRAQNFARLGGSFLQNQGGAQENILGARQALDSAQQNRAQQRLERTSGLFGFGQDLQDVGFQRGLQGLGAAQSIDDQLRAQTALGLEGGASGAAAGANVARAELAGAGSLLGGAFSGAGQAITQNSGAIGDFFRNRRVGNQVDDVLNTPGLF